jgi:MFS transporter, DHA2 family, multidrug resistance protein
MLQHVHERRITGNKYQIAISVMITAITAILDSTIVNVSIPNIQAAFGVDVEQITWVITGYLISNVTIIPMTGWLASRIGLKRYYMLSQVVFVVASMLCGLAWNLPTLIFFRILQGFGGGALLPVSLSIMLEAFPPEETAQVTAIFGMGAVLGPIIGPTLGGWLTENFSWRWIFYVNLPIVVVGLLWTYFSIHTPKRERVEKRPVDGIGFGLTAVWVTALQILLEEGQRNSWFESSYICSMLAIAIVAFAAFIWHELTTPTPFINLRIFGDRNFAVGTAMGSVLGAALFGSIFLVPIYAASILGFNALNIGLMMLPGALLTFPMFPLAARLTPFVDARILCTVGFIGLGLSSYGLAFVDAQTSWSQLVWLQVIGRAALPFMFVPLSTISLQYLPQHWKPDAASLSNLSRTLAGSFAVAILGSFYTNRERFHFARMGESITQWSSQTAQRLSGLQHYFERSGVDPVSAQHQALGALSGTLAQQASIAAFDDAFRVVAIFCFASIALVMLVRRVGAGAPQQAAPAQAMPAARPAGAALD